MVSISRGLFGRKVEFRVGEHVMVLTDDEKEWKDAAVTAFFPNECESEGYRIPAGTVKVSYALGVKWVMPKNMSKTLRRRAEDTGTSSQPMWPARSAAGSQSQANTATPSEEA